MLQVQTPHRLLGKQVPGSPQPTSLTPRPTTGRGRAEFKGARVEGGSTEPQSPCAQSWLQEGSRAEQSLNLCSGLTAPPPRSLPTGRTWPSEHAVGVETPEGDIPWKPLRK